MNTPFVCREATGAGIMAASAALLVGLFFLPCPLEAFLFFVPPGDDDDPSRNGFVGRSLEERRMYSLYRR
jgi:hypothetical protein